MAKEIAVVGGGIAGLTAAFLLSRRHRVTLFEKRQRLGGNAYSYQLSTGQWADIAVAAFGRAGYREFFELIDDLGVTAAQTPTSFVSTHNLDTQDGLYFTLGKGTSWRDKLQALRPKNAVALMKLAQGLRTAQRMRKQDRLGNTTLGDLLAQIPQLQGDARILLLAVLCLLSSMTGDQVLAAPASFFLEKLSRHDDVLSPKIIYSVQCVHGGTRAYVEALASRFRAGIRLGQGVERVHRSSAGVEIEFDSGQRQPFDTVVVACQPDEAFALLAMPTDRERRLLGPWRCNDGRLVVHRDFSHFPPDHLMQAFTFLYTDRGNRFATSVNGALWHEPGMPKHLRYVGAQHPNYPIAKELVELETTLRTPIFNHAAVKTISELPRLNGVNNTYFCGSYFGFGLHNDAVCSARAAAAAIG